MLLKSWVVAYLDNARAATLGGNWPKPARQLPPVFSALARPDERVLAWDLPDIEAERLADQLREFVEVIFVVPQPAASSLASSLDLGLANYELLQESWRYQLEYVDPGAESRSAAEWGLAEAAYEAEAGPISLVEHRYILEGLYDLAEKFAEGKGRLKLPRTQGRWRAELVAEAALSGLRKADETVLRSALRHEISQGDLSYAELLALPVFLSTHLFTQLADIVRENRLMRAADVLGRRAVELLTSLSDDQMAVAVKRFVPLADAALVESVWYKLTGEPTIRRTFTAAAGHHEEAANWRRHEDERRRQFALSVTIARLLARLDWARFLEETDPVYAELKADFTGTYTQMTLETRERYRREVAGLAEWSRRTDLAVAHAAREASGRTHIGNVLVGDGRASFERSIGAKLPVRTVLQRRLQKRPTAAYVGTWLAIWAAAMLILAASGYMMGLSPWLIGLLAICVSGLATEFTNFWLTKLLPPRFLPELDVRASSMSGQNLVLAVPTLLSANIQADLYRLELRFLANRLPNLAFGLLVDPPDAATESLPTDDALLAAAEAGIRDLAERYPDGRFFLFHRPRTYANSELTWLARERKRGKIEDFVEMLVTGAHADWLKVGNIDWLRGAPYLISLDADTTLPPGAAARLFGTISHPLNAHYGIVQPHVTTSYESATANGLSRLYHHQPGTDPYLRSFSDVYFDLSGDGIYHGKGVLNVARFYERLHGRLPEGRILSHDLLEGAYVHVALATDIVLYDDFPATLAGLEARNQRWTRGDWQLGGWLGRRVPTANGTEPTPLSRLNRFKIGDNLRRSLILPLMLAALVVGAATQHLAPVTMVILVVTCLPAFVTAPLGRNYWRGVTIGLRARLYELTVMPYRGFRTLEAILRALWRVYMSHHFLLQWRTAAEASGQAWTGLDRWFVLQLAFGVVILALQPGLLAALILASFTAGIVITTVLERPRRPVPSPIGPADRAYLRRIALQTWTYFDDFMLPSTHFLPPDNYQLAYKNKLAPRTSPTNIGLALVAWVEAVEFGFSTTNLALDRLEAATLTLEELERYRGHFYNWYDVTTCEPVGQRFVSTVDSGNLVMGFWALREGLRDFVGRPIIGAAQAEGLQELLEELHDRSSHWPDTLYKELSQAITGLRSQTTAIAFLSSVAGLARLVRARSASLAEITPSADGVRERFTGQVASLDAQLADYLGWLRQLGDAPASLRASLPELDAIIDAPVSAIPSLAEIVDDSWRERLVHLSSAAAGDPWLGEVIAQFQVARERAARQVARIEALSATITKLADHTDFEFMYNHSRRSFHIGYDVDNATLNRSFYDLLASEARTASFVAVASAQVPAKHWWSLGRSTRLLGRKPTLLSWSGTMFEYLMPRLFLRNYPATLLDQGIRQAVAVQQSQAQIQQVPWGISESGYSDLDADDTYQYRAYGAGALAVQAMPEEGTVVAPYASCLALMVDPVAAITNLRELERLGLRGRYGFYEAVDYRRPYRPSGERGLIVYSYMSHHQGMALLALSNALHDDVIVRRVERDPRVAAAASLLQERPSRPDITGADQLLPALRPLRPIEPVVVADTLADLAQPIVPQYLFSNGRLTTMITARGEGYIRWNNFELGRWEADPIIDQGGLHLYLRDDVTGHSWRLGPTTAADQFRVESLPEGLSFETTSRDITSRLEVMVAPDADVEIRYLRLGNTGRDARELSLTSFFEFGMAAHEAQRAHPAFNQLFITTEVLPEYDGVLASRRHRADTEEPLFVAHLLVNLSQPANRSELGNDRASFIGRVGDRLRPAGLDEPLVSGPTVDPAAVVRQSLVVPAGDQVELAVLTLVGQTRDEILQLAERYRQAPLVRRVRQAAWATAEAELQRLQTSHAETELFQALGGYLTYPNALLKLGAAGLVATGSRHEELPPHALVVSISDLTDLTLVRQVWLAGAFLERRGIATSMMVLIRTGGGAKPELVEALERLRGRMESLLGDRVPGFDFVHLHHISPHSLAAIIAGARVVLDGAAGSLTEQLAGVPRLTVPAASSRPALAELPAAPEPDLPLSLGGFNGDGRIYQFDLDGATTPAPWSNVIANSVFGTLVTERGSGFTWDGNSQQNQLTPWRNDAVADRPSDAWYVAEAASREFWSVLPMPGETPHLRVEHGLGWSKWTGSRAGLNFEVEVTVPQGEERPRRVRLSTLRLTNTTNRSRQLVVSAMAELTLGAGFEQEWRPVRTVWRAPEATLLFRSPAPGLRDAIVYAALNRPVLDNTTSRAEAFGVVGDGLPLGLMQSALSGRVGRDFRPVAALRTAITLAPGQSISITSYLGAANNEHEALHDVERLRRLDASAVRDQALAVWGELTGTITVRTPDPKLDAMLNYWLIYQVISSRLWGRTGYYQSSGAYGFRDQLQDVMALVYTHPAMARLQILTAANHQYEEGDTQHWWQPLTLLGLRSRISDDRLWLPYATARYIEVTGDIGILDVEVPYITGPKLAEGENELYHEATLSARSGTLMEHLRRAVAASRERGRHGLPLIGSGDWCDGYNRVGLAGQGETVWGAWFLAVVEDDLAKLLDQTGHATAAATLRADAVSLRQAAAKAWDGHWYRRGYYDDGTPLGSAQSEEGQIDSLSQSWAILAGLQSSRERTALDSAVEHLVDPAAGIVRLLAPSFDKTSRDPGYIRGYLPGVRENGGQYTHGSVWLAIAAARLGQASRAVNLLSLMLPTWHGATKERQARYQIEPYVMAGDVYAYPGLEGRGGWSWYTGSAGWMYRAWIEEILGLTITGDRLSLAPVIPAEWPGFELTYRHGNTVYELAVHNQAAPDGITHRLDGEACDEAAITMVDDGATHHFEVWL